MFEQHAIADEEKPHIWNVFYDLGCRIHQLVVALEREKPGDLADDR